MRARKVVVGYDGSDASRRALSAAADLMRYGSTLAVVTVRSAEGQGGADVLDTAREQLLRSHVHARYVERVGVPPEQLVNAADELHADLLVVGGRASGLGPVGAAVVHDAPCDVLVVR